MGIRYVRTNHPFFTRHFIKPPSIMLSWQNSDLISFRVHHWSIIYSTSSALHNFCPWTLLEVLRFPDEPRSHRSYALNPHLSVDDGSGTVITAICLFVRERCSLPASCDKNDIARLWVARKFPPLASRTNRYQSFVDPGWAPECPKVKN